MARITKAEKDAAGGEVQIAIFTGRPLLTASEFTVI